MNILSFTGAKLLDAVDIAFDVAGAMLRVVRRGAFTPDARSCRGDRYRLLAATDILLQDIALNADSVGEARRAVALDPQSLLPLDPGELVFDIAGPLASAQMSARRERRFLLGAVRKHTLRNLREALSPGARGGVEAFVFFPDTAPDAVLAFEDARGRSTRRRRRAATAAALAVFVYAAGLAATDADSALDQATAGMETQRTALSRRLRAAERQMQNANALLAAVQQSDVLSLSAASHRLAQLSRALPADAQIDALNFAGATLTLQGVAYNGDETELALRRSFESDRIVFDAQTGASPAPFEARLSREAVP